jgi:hypothetical protein
MAVNPQLDVLADKIAAAATLVEFLQGEVDAVSATGWATMLGDLRRLSSTVSSATETAVTAARAGGYSWQDIGEALNMTKQGAQQRYGR